MVWRVVRFFGYVISFAGFLFIISSRPDIIRETRYAYYGNCVLFSVYFTSLLVPWYRLPLKARNRNILMGVSIAITVYVAVFLINRLIITDPGFLDTHPVGIIAISTVIILILLQIPAVLWERRYQLERELMKKRVGRRI